MKTPGALKNVMEESQNDCKRYNLRADEEKQQKEEDTGIRPVGRENKVIKRGNKNEQSKQDNK